MCGQASSRTAFAPLTEVAKGSFRTSALLPNNDPEGNGEWSPLIDLGIIPIHAITLPNGLIFSYGSTETGIQGGQFVNSLFDQTTGQARLLPNTSNTNISCSGTALDPVTDNVIIMGGDGSQSTSALSGINDVLIFDPLTETSTT